MSKKNLIFIIILILAALSACKPKTAPSAESQINAAVAATIAAQPEPAIYPTYTPYPTFTPAAHALQGLFCEYQFCIGHPADLALFDARPKENPSVYSDGMLAAYRTDFFNLIAWQYNHGSDDPQFMFDLIMGFSGIDSQRGTLDVSLLGDLTTFYAPLTIPANKNFPVGGVAAWVCGDRAFSWMAYTTNEELARALFEEAISKFRCNE